MDAAQTQVQQAQIIEKLKQKLAGVKLPPDVSEKLADELMRVELVFKTKDFNPELDRQINYINFVCDLPWDKAGQDILDLKRAKMLLDKNHHGLEPIKDRILEYFSICRFSWVWKNLSGFFNCREFGQANYQDSIWRIGICFAAKG